MEWDEFALAPRDVQVVIGHSMGASRAVAEFGNSDIPVFALDSPTRFGNHDNVRYIGNLADPVSLLGMVMDPIDAIMGLFNGDTFLDLSFNPHDKNKAWDQIKGEVLDN